MNEIWDKDGIYTVKSIDAKYKVKVEYWDIEDKRGVDIDIKDNENSLIDSFSILLKTQKLERLDKEG